MSCCNITSRSRHVLAAEISVARHDLAATSRRVFARRDFHILLGSRQESQWHRARFWPPRFPASRWESRRDRGEFLVAEISRISARIAARFWPLRFPYLTVILLRSHVNITPRSRPWSRRGAEIAARWGNLGGQKTRRDLAEIVARSRWDRIKIFTREGLLNVVCVWFFLKNCSNHCSKWIEAVWSHRHSCRSSNERVCNHSIRTMLTTEPSYVCLIELKTIKSLTWKILSMQHTETRLWRWGTLEFTILLFWSQTTKCSCSQFRARGRNGKSNSQTTLRAIQCILHGIQFLDLNIWSCRNTERPTTSTGKPVSILHGIAKKCRPFWHWICSMLFVQTAAYVLTRHKSVTILLNASLPFQCALFCLASI